MAVQFLPEDKAGLLSTVLESLLYGFSLLMFIGTMWTLLRRSEVNRPMVVVACLLFCLSTIHLGVDINRLNTGLILYRDAPGGPQAFFANPSQTSFVFKNAVYSFQTVLGDGVVIYRCYMVWRSIWACVLPSILWLGVAVTATGSVYTCTRPSTDSADIYVRELGRWITAFYSTTLACNLTATSILSYRLWTVNRSIQRSRIGRGVTMPVLLVVMDAGALYSVTLLAALICFVLQSNGQYVVLDMVTPIISIAFYMVILRIGVSQNNRSNRSATDQSVPRIPLTSRSDTSTGSKPMHVHIQVEQSTGDRPSSVDVKEDKEAQTQNYRGRL
ncbi:hypothetical protein B0H16DRAFT_1673074 [Mycena metata]|uniref:Uncharacterized protein n=1 Tax=Mycena metata TaxID=1033252 RepID=A0AAD7NR33_9AGAR|nr:hypothetical protein B0H16DRAFT_1673074 [Mycena metata]